MLKTVIHKVLNHLYFWSKAVSDGLQQLHVLVLLQSSIETTAHYNMPINIQYFNTAKVGKA